MTRRVFNWLLPLLPVALLGKARGVTVKLAGLDPRFVAQMKIAADSRDLSLEQWIVYAAVLESGYHLNDGFLGEQN